MYTTYAEEDQYGLAIYSYVRAHTNQSHILNKYTRTNALIDVI